jgi:hypothetical protein
VNTKLELILASGITCYNATATPASALANCTTNNGFVLDDGVDCGERKRSAVRYRQHGSDPGSCGSAEQLDELHARSSG